MLKLSAVFALTSAIAGVLITDRADWNAKIHVDSPMVAAAYVGLCPIYRKAGHTKLVQAETGDVTLQRVAIDDRS